jgi:hypothetical protein
MVTFARPAERNRIREQLRNRIDDVCADPVVNRVNIHAVADYRSLALGRRTYRVPPITYRVGVQLDALQLRFQRLRAYNERALAGVCRASVSVCRIGLVWPALFPGRAGALDWLANGFAPP